VDKLFDMIEFATLKHKGQYRKDGKTPYICHPLDVLKRLIYWGIDTNEHVDLACAAVGHDLAEDTDALYEEIKELFGERVANLIDALTFSNSDSPTIRRVKKKAWMDSFATAPIDVFVLKTADRIVNLKDFLAEDHEYAKKYFEKARSLWDFTDKIKNGKRWQEIRNVYGGSVAMSIGQEWYNIASDLTY